MKVKGSRNNAAGDVAVCPFEGLGALVVAADVFHDLALEVDLGSEDAPRDEVALDLREPDLDLVEPGGIGGCVVDVNGGVVFKEGGDTPGFMSERLSAMMWISLPAGWVATTSARNATNSALVWRLAVFPTMAPLVVSSAA